MSMIVEDSNMKLNVVFMGDIPYPKGMASTKRVQHAIDAFQENDIDCRVIIFRQSTALNQSEGVYRGTTYHTLIPDLIGWRLSIFLPLLVIKSFSAIRRVFKADKKNILFIYGPPSASNILAVIYAQRIGFLTVFDIIEDYNYSIENAKNWEHRVKIFIIQQLIKRIKKIADGLVVISTALEKKYRKLTYGQLPIHLRPISIDPKRFMVDSGLFGKNPTMFYSGSFGVKDGVSELLDAFESLAARHTNLKLIMTGRGTEQRMKEVFERIKASPVKNRIEYKGYLDDDEYYETLKKADIPCMTRINSGYANAGFPFKLGEFLATGKPVIASKVSDIEKIMKDQYDAILVEPSDSAEIASAVEYLLTSPKIASEIGKRGRDKAHKLFNYQSQGKELLKFFYSL